MKGGQCPCSGQAGGKRSRRSKKGGSLKSLGKRSLKSLKSLRKRSLRTLRNRTLRSPKILTGFIKSIAKAVSCKNRKH